MVFCPSAPPPFYVRIEVSHPATRLLHTNNIAHLLKQKQTFLKFAAILRQETVHLAEHCFDASASEITAEIRKVLIAEKKPLKTLDFQGLF